MKDHICEVRLLDFDLDGDIDVLYNLLKDKAKGLISPRLSAEHDYEGCSTYYIEGWRPMTDEEKNDAAAKAKKLRDEKKAAKLAQEEAERKMYESLRQKFETKE